ncbi:MAG: prephenate dehydratase [Candidatus Omnitrophica bacterium]|nr:prephenate dehydratase [Candidatus Omnitrophota bacterium]MCM8798247.1 prephenate dehydratase [Candidatus Omnitrophota bacterium]
MELKRLREKIDVLDKKIVALLNERAELTLEIARIKKKLKEPTYVPDREREVYRKIKSANKGPLSEEAITSIYREIMSSSLSLEKPLKIAYLGPPATFTHLAALNKFGTQVEYLDCRSISEVFNEVEKGNAEYGVVPIENSIEGAVTHTLDMFVDSEINICSEISLEIRHNLLANCREKEIKRVYSNPQVFGQCRIWLESNLPRAELLEVSSTTKAAEIASQEKFSAAIASEMAARRYGLKILAHSIEDSPHNVTRFLVIGKMLTRPTGKDKTSIMFSIKDRVGALHDMLYPFKKHNINLTKIESRPSKRKPWDYYFFIDLEGHIEDKEVKSSLTELKEICTYLKVLGSYPASE